MKVTIIQTTTKTFDINRILLSTRLNETYLIEPEADKILRHKTTGQLFYAGLCLDQERKISEYEEIQKQEN
jgi:hypothetical protein